MKVKVAFPSYQHLVDIFGVAVCAGVCLGDEWRIIAGNAPLADFLQIPMENLAGESFLTRLYSIEYGLGVDAVKNGPPHETVCFAARGRRYAFVWSPLPQEEDQLGAGRGSAGVSGSAGKILTAVEDIRYFIFHALPHAQEYGDQDMLWKQMNVILDSVHDGVWMIDGEGITVHVNKAMKRIAGIEPETVLGRHVTVPLLEGKFTSCVTLTALKERKQVTLFDDYSSGKRCLNTSTPIFDNKGKVWRVVASIRDLSELEDLQLKLEEAERAARLHEDARQLKKSLPGFVASSSTMRGFLRELERAAKTPLNLLLLGETGTGKTLAASLIHQKSDRAKAPFITVNCGAIPPTLIESELFGYEKGAFTGAAQEGKKGFFELADGGVIFLDEIGELPLNMQTKLLHVLDNHSFRRLGGTKNITVDIRVLAATNRPLETLVNNGEFRADLYYRLRVLTVSLPPLRERLEDIEDLSRHFLVEACKRHGVNRFFDSRVLRCFTAHSWPGNVRELRATVEFMAAMSEGKIISTHNLPPHLKHSAQEAGSGPVESTAGLREAVRHLEYNMLKDALVRTGSTYKAAASLGVSQSTVVRKARQLGITTPED